ncbi:MAG: PocR ligand-binding domain-containing protein [Clostridium baratii]|uniref:Histidine kinase family protein n=1 Tax=Clostridium baratii str. Sullivan TaxID=1415775 RepID=A0A0A7FZE6_9CLOT|nr:PocR ligand-binding domain-containing protein [Clostridium baratii]AIY84978.1 histidine kinase family protein [Clostridium baratii str. Sullivan]MBS6006393.1 PocR ligand-binding domain-containing protein [Clostridium baratii]MDU1053937.1 PocR ligand-binding domain-containing protein [Clostridium baratii]CUO88844.1 sensor histidine kinase [Clostridium baratii]
MPRRILYLNDVIDIEIFQKIQDDIAEATGISIITVDYKGKPATKHSKCSEFCKLMRKNERFSELCEKCDSRGGLEAARLEKPYIYRCHKGLVDFATPIIVNGQYLGSVMAGQVLTEEEDLDLENIVNGKDNFKNLEEKEELLKAYKKLPVFKFERIQSIANMMFHISNYIVEEAVLKMAQKELNDKNIKFIEAKKERAELEKEYEACKLKALQAQINPHFLFNVLNSISALAIIEEAPKTQEVIFNLSNMLRYTLKKADKVVSIEEELKYIESYLALQKVRFGDRLNYEIDVSDNVKNHKIPFMSIQTFVENSIVHGLEGKEEGGIINIFSKEDEDSYTLCIKDNGTGITENILNGLKDELEYRYGKDLDKIGINNVNKRMAKYYGDDYKIEIESKVREGTLVKIIFKKDK